MSRSRRKKPIFGHTSAKSDHPWKKAAARRLRRRVNQHLSATLESDRFADRPWDLESDWSSAKDGKFWWAGAGPKEMRK
ncbi:MAG: hypothetical protein ACREBO_10780 [Novosphingobium sp.]